MTVDGTKNRVTELDYVAEEVPGPQNVNVNGNGVFVRKNELKTELQAARKTEPRAEVLRNLISSALFLCT